MVYREPKGSNLKYLMMLQIKIKTQTFFVNEVN